jgi:tetratricopeptide (TPR) repeat protein
MAACREHAATDDVLVHVLWRTARAMLHARCGEHEAAEALAKEAVELARPTDSLELRGDAYLRLAEVLQLAARREQARAAAEVALELYDRKEYVVAASRTRKLRTQIDAEVPAVP